MKMVKGIGALTSRVKRRRLPRQWKIINVLIRTFPLSERLLISTLSAFSYVIGVVWAVWVRWKAAFLKYRPLKAFRRLFLEKRVSGEPEDTDYVIGRTFYSEVCGKSYPLICLVLAYHKKRNDDDDVWCWNPDFTSENANFWCARN